MTHREEPHHKWIHGNIIVVLAKSKSNRTYEGIVQESTAHFKYVLQNDFTDKQFELTMKTYQNDMTTANLNLRKIVRPRYRMRLE